MSVSRTTVTVPPSRVISEHHPECRTSTGSDGTPHDLFGPEPLDIRCLARPEQPMPHRCCPTQQAVHPPTEVGDDWCGDRRERPTAGPGLAEQSGGSGGVRQVGQHPLGETGTRCTGSPARRGRAPARGRGRGGRRGGTAPRSSQHPLVLGEPPDPHHDPVSEQGDPAADARGRGHRPLVEYACTDSGRVDSIARTTQGAATASRAALTVHDWRVSISARVRASSRRKVDRVRSNRPRSLPPTSRAIRIDSTSRSPTGSLSRSLRRSRQSWNRPVRR